jgi:hypothetical protein
MGRTDCRSTSTIVATTIMITERIAYYTIALILGITLGKLL